jgi:hypothetical protein
MPPSCSPRGRGAVSIEASELAPSSYSKTPILATPLVSPCARRSRLRASPSPSVSAPGRWKGRIARDYARLVNRRYFRHAIGLLFVGWALVSLVVMALLGLAVTLSLTGVHGVTVPRLRAAFPPGQRGEPRLCPHRGRACLPRCLEVGCSISARRLPAVRARVARADLHRPVLRIRRIPVRRRLWSVHRHPATRRGQVPDPQRRARPQRGGRLTGGRAHRVSVRGETAAAGAST